MAKKTLIKGGYFYDGNGKQFTKLSDALTNDTKCGCGINCKQGFISLPNFNSDSGDVDNFFGLYISDGELVVDSISNVKEQLNSNCSGGSQTPQALRLTFDSIANANTLVGDASNVADWNTFFDLPNLGTAFTSVTIAGNEVQLFGGANIKVKPGLMYYNNTILISVVDEAGCITSVGGDAFSYNQNLTTLNLPACTIVYDHYDSPNTDDSSGLGSLYALTSVNMPSLVTIEGYTFQEAYALESLYLPSLVTAGDGCFSSCTSLINVNLPNLETAGYASFYDCTSLTTINLPNIISVGIFFCGLCPSLTTISIPSCTDLGGTVGDDNVFDSIIGNTITLTVPSALMTNNGGNPDGDIQELQANNTVTIVTV